MKKKYAEQFIPEETSIVSIIPTNDLKFLKSGELAKLVKIYYKYQIPFFVNMERREFDSIDLWIPIYNEGNENG